MPVQTTHTEPKCKVGYFGLYEPCVIFLGGQKRSSLPRLGHLEEKPAKSHLISHGSHRDWSRENWKKIKTQRCKHTLPSLRVAGGKRNSHQSEGILQVEVSSRTAKSGLWTVSPVVLLKGATHCAFHRWLARSWHCTPVRVATAHPKDSPPSCRSAKLCKDAEIPLGPLA